jgi:hypothetical protein
MQATLRWFLLVLACAAGPLWAQAPGNRPACAVLRALDLKPLLGGDYDAPVPFGESSCRAESKAIGRMVILMVREGSATEILSWMEQMRKIDTTEQAADVTVAPEPALGAQAFSAAEKGERRGVDIYAMKGSSAMVLQASWSVGSGINDATFTQLRGVAQAALNKLP